MVFLNEKKSLSTRILGVCSFHTSNSRMDCMITLTAIYRTPKKNGDTFGSIKGWNEFRNIKIIQKSIITYGKKYCLGKQRNLVVDIISNKKHTY